MGFSIAKQQLLSNFTPVLNLPQLPKSNLCYVFDGDHATKSTSHVISAKSQKNHRIVAMIVKLNYGTLHTFYQITLFEPSFISEFDTKNVKTRLKSGKLQLLC